MRILCDIRIVVLEFFKVYQELSYLSDGSFELRNFVNSHDWYHGDGSGCDQESDSGGLDGIHVIAVLLRLEVNEAEDENSL